MRNKVDYQERYISFLEEQVKDLKRGRDILFELLNKESGQKIIEEVKETREFKPIKKAPSWLEVRKALEEKSLEKAKEKQAS